MNDLDQQQLVIRSSQVMNAPVLAIVFSRGESFQTLLRVSALESVDLLESWRTILYMALRVLLHYLCSS